MKVLVANLGSTSFKYRLYDLGDPSEPLLARGAVERIGTGQAKAVARTDRGRAEWSGAMPDHGAALGLCLEQLTEGETAILGSAEEIGAIGFKAVHARGFTGVQRVDETLLIAMEEYNDVLPAHNPPYIRAMRALRERFPAMPLVAAFETGFHRTIPEARQRYAIPEEWTDAGIRRWGYHGASHRYVSERVAELVPGARKIISCHLGGSSSLCAIRDGESVATSMGMSPQSGLPQNNRVGDLDVFALPVVMRSTGRTLEQVLAALAGGSGLDALGGCGNDLRDIEKMAAVGDGRALLAIEHFADAIRHYMGAYLVHLDGADVIAFTGGIGENSTRIRERVCADLDWFGIELDGAANASGPAERAVSTAKSRVALWVLPTNEEIVVARQARDLLAGGA